MTDPSEDNMPQPLSRVKPAAQVFVRVTALPPDLCVFVTRAITAWAYTDHLFAQMLAGFLKADFEVASAMYAALVSGEAKRAALLAAANAANPDDVPLIQAVIRSIRPSRNERNDFAHHIWATSPDLPDSLILIDPAALTEPNIKVRSMAAQGLLQPKATKVGKATRVDFPQLPVPDKNRMMVYRTSDLRNAAESAEQCTDVVLALAKACSATYPDVKARQLLLSEPRIAQALARLSPENAPAVPPQPPQ